MLHVLVLKEDGCESCEEVVGELETLKQRFPEMRVRERLLEDEPELARRLGVVAAPAVVVNDQLAFQGHPDGRLLETYFRNVQQGLHDDPYAYPPDDERDREAQGQEVTGSVDPVWRGSDR